MDLITRILSLTLSPALYSQYRYTNLDSELRIQVPDPSKWCTVVAPGALVLTSDGKFAFTKRPIDAHLSPGRIDMPCGHPSGLTPTQESLPAAIELIVQKEIGEVNVLSMKPLILIFEEPKSAYDLIYVVIVKETSRELLALGKVETMIDNSPEAIAKFLNHENNVSRPVHYSLTYFGRKQYGEEWFLQFCRDKN